MQRYTALLLLALTLVLLALGVCMIWSTNSMVAANDMQAVLGSVKKQLLWLGVGAVLWIFLTFYDYQRLIPFAPWILGCAALLLLCCFIPGLGGKINGSPRWIHIIGTWRYQPSEFSKIALIFFLASWLGHHRARLHEFKYGILYPILFSSPILGLIAREEDFGTTALLLIVMFLMLFCSGAPLYFVLLGPLVGIGLLVAAVSLKHDRMDRIYAWMAIQETQSELASSTPSATPHDLTPAQIKTNARGDQQRSALVALGSGGLTGLGLGNGRQKWGFLPEVQTDFVFAVIGEELGMWFTLFVVFAYLLFLLCGTVISVHAPDTTGVLLGLGLTSIITLQAMMNLAVVTSMMPCKGIPLPFVSYGGSDLLTCLAAVGFLFNLHRQGVFPSAPPAPSPSVLINSYSVRM